MREREREKEKTLAMQLSVEEADVFCERTNDIGNAKDC